MLPFLCTSEGSSPTALAPKLSAAPSNFWRGKPQGCWRPRPGYTLVSDTTLMIRHGVGVRVADTRHVKKVDEDFFPRNDCSELVADCLADLHVGLADKIVGGGEPAEVGHSLQVPDDDARFHAGGSVTQHLGVKKDVL